MGRKKQSEANREARHEARSMIIDAANVVRIKNRGHDLVAPLTARHIQNAVCIVRRNRMVSDDTLAVAGFNSKRAVA